MFVKQRRQRTPVVRVELSQKLMGLNRPFDEQGIDEHQAVLQQLQTQRRDLLLVTTIGGKIPCRP